MLTTDQKQIVEMIVAGKPYKQIADNLKIPVQKIDSHLIHLRKYHNCQNTTQLCFKLFQNGLISPKLGIDTIQNKQ